MLEILLEFKHWTQMTVSPGTNRPECDPKHYLHCVAPCSESDRDGLMKAI